MLYYVKASNVLFAKISLISSAYYYADINSAQRNVKVPYKYCDRIMKLGYRAGKASRLVICLSFIPDTINVANEENDYR